MQKYIKRNLIRNGALHIIIFLTTSFYRGLVFNAFFFQLFQVLSKKEKCPSLAPPRSNFSKT
jgi:hypothetical protein